MSTGPSDWKTWEIEAEVPIQSPKVLRGEIEECLLWLVGLLTNWSENCLVCRQIN